MKEFNVFERLKELIEIELQQIPMQVVMLDGQWYLKQSEVFNLIDRYAKSHSKTQSLGEIAPSESENKDFTAHSDSPKVSAEGYCYECQEADGNYLCDKQYCECKCHRRKPS